MNRKEKTLIVLASFLAAIFVFSVVVSSDDDTISQSPAVTDEDSSIRFELKRIATTLEIMNKQEC